MPQIGEYDVRLNAKYHVTYEVAEAQKRTFNVEIGYQLAFLFTAIMPLCTW